MRRKLWMSTVLTTATSLTLVCAVSGRTGVLDGLLRLQSTTPGTQQIGNANLSGTVIAGQFQGGGTGITNVNAATLNGLTSSAFLPSAPPIAISGNSSVNILRVDNLYSATLNGYAVECFGANALHGKSTVSGGIGVYGEGTNAILGNGSGTGSYGVFGQSSGNSSSGGYFQSFGSNGLGLSAISGSTGQTYGAFCQSGSPTGFGVYGYNASGSGDAFGGYFKSESHVGRGAYGVCGVSGDSGVAGIYGGTLSTQPSSYGVYSFGNMAATGLKSFEIDDPLDPANKYLKHYCAEGPEPENIYNGTAITDAKGYAWVQLPPYYQEINKEPRYQLTVIDSSDDFVQAKISQEIVDGRFQIRTSKPNVKVCWEVKAVRNDPWVRMNGAPVEIEKPDSEKGKYQIPRAYGMPDTMQMNREEFGEPRPRMASR